MKKTIFLSIAMAALTGSLIAGNAGINVPAAVKEALQKNIQMQQRLPGKWKKGITRLIGAVNPVRTLP